MKVLITGGCGFLGSNLAQYAIMKHHEVVVFDNLYRFQVYNNLSWLSDQGKYTFIHGDIRSPNDIKRVVIDFCPDVIFHLVGQVAMTVSVANPRLDFEVNAIGTFNLLEAIRLHSPDTTVIYASTNKVYGSLEQYTYRETITRYECTEKPQGFDESTSLEFHSPYGCSKGAADQYMLDYARTYGLKTVVFRHSSMYGGRQYATFDQGWIGWFCQKALEIKQHMLNEPLTISGNGKQVRDILHIEDVINLYFSAAANIAIIQGQVFNIGGGKNNSMSILELLSVLENKLNITINYTMIPARASDQKIFIADISKIKDAIQWRPLIDSESGIDKMLEWSFTLINKVI